MQSKLYDTAGITIGLSNPTFSLTGGAASTFVTAASTDFAINGKVYSKAGGAGQTTPTTDYNTGIAPVGLTAVNTGTVLLFGLNAAGTYLMAQGSVEITDSAGNFINSPKFPVVTDNFCPIGYVVVKAGPTLAAPFVPGTGNWNQTGISTSAVGLIALPDRPVVA